LLLPRHAADSTRLLTVVGTVAVRYEAVASVEVGLAAVPGWLAWKVGYNPGFGTRRAGIFWWRGSKWVMDVSEPGRTLVVHVKPGGAGGYGAVAVTVDDPDALAAELRSRAAL
jgi:hypothetical protein